ncbi:N-acylglucosamine 2-epimerase-like [Amphiura filiformis]|uniref:N-acylglucosamine 2-epimerase-like n=1 Tax=Amphiura filiformis TaxID=82378 RepID=UPI003B20C28A
MSATSRLPEYLVKMQKELDRAMEFWLKNSHDEEYGGFFTCLGKDGKRFDDLKYCWLQGRQVWMYSKLYNSIPRFHTEEVLQAARAGGEFLMKHVKSSDGMKCNFLLTRDGKPVKIQRQIFSESFYLVGLAELARATKDDKYKKEAIAMMDQIVHWIRVDGSGLGRPALSGAPPVNALAVSMTCIYLIKELTWDDPGLYEKYAELEQWSLDQTLAHVQRQGSVVLEIVSTDGKELPGSQGRIMNPGHAIEAGWFLLQLAVDRKDDKLKKIALENFMINPYLLGWDKEHGGLFAFLDADGLSPTQLEWNMKLWWAHNEALISFLMAYKETKDEQYLKYFEQVFDYSFKHFADLDSDHGEWFGYLTQAGTINQDIKGGPFKGCFHVPRCFMMCEEMLRELLDKK